VTSMREELIHFLTHHLTEELIVVPVPWLPRNGLHWYLPPDVDAIALSQEAWESGQLDVGFWEEGIRLRLPRLCERLPARERCPGCPPRPQAASTPPTREEPAGRPTVNDLGLLARR
jgi:hypothetical protein